MSLECVEVATGANVPQHDQVVFPTDLQHGLFYATNLSKSNLRGVWFNQSLLAKANLDNADMEDV